MAVTEQTPLNSYTANGVTTVFAFSFLVLQAADLVVLVDGAQKTLGVDYTVAGVGIGAGGTVNFLAAPASPLNVTVYRDSAIKRQTDYQDNGDLLADTLNLDIDRLWLVLQEIFNGGKGPPTALRVPNGETVPVLPKAAQRANTQLLFDAAGNPYVAAPVSGSAADVLLQLASPAAGKGAALLAVKRSLTGALATTQHAINEFKQIDPTVEFGVPIDGVTDCTPSIQAMNDALRDSGIAADIVFPPYTYKCLSPASETGEPRSYAAAVIWRGLKNVRIRGAGAAKFIQGTGSAGAPEYALFRFEPCENVEMCNLSADGSGINIYGTGAARSSFAFICNHDLDTFADFPTANRNIHIHHLILDNFGGGICSATRNESTTYPLINQGLSIHDIRASNIAGQNHFAGITYSENVHIYNNKVVNPLTLTAQIGNLFCDMSAGVTNAVVENNYCIGTTGGAKAETHTGKGPSGTEDRVSQNVTFRNNTFEQVGDPITMIYPGAGGGGWYGIKLNGINHSAYNNTITARSANISTGGLYQGVQLVNTSVNPVETVHTVFGNDIRGPVIGINHDNPSDPNRRYQANILCNKIRDTYRPASLVSSNDGTGIIVSKNALVRDNKIYRTPYCAITINSPDQTLIRDNSAFNCASVNHAIAGARVVYSEEAAGAQGFFEFSNNSIIDERGSSAANYGYMLRAGTTYANKYILTPGLTDSVVTGISFDKYRSALGISSPVDSTTVRAPLTVYATGNPPGTAPWSGMAWQPGDRAINRAPTVGQPKAWVCTVSGTPGTWVSEGSL